MKMTLAQEDGRERKRERKQKKRGKGRRSLASLLEKVEVELTISTSREELFLVVVEVPVDAEHLVGVTAQCEEWNRRASVPHPCSAIERGRCKLEVVLWVPLDIRNDSLVRPELLSDKLTLFFFFFFRTHNDPTKREPR
jgi:hypothetical protein